MWSMEYDRWINICVDGFYLLRGFNVVKWYEFVEFREIKFDGMDFKNCFLIVFIGNLIDGI